MSDVTQVFRADGEQWFNTMSRMLDQFDKLVQKATDLTKISKDAVNEIKKANTNFKEGVTDTSDEMANLDNVVDGVTGKIVALGTAYFGVQKIVSTITEEMQKQAALAEKAKSSQVTVADAEGNVLRNLGAKSVDEAKSYLDNIRSMSATAGVSDVRTTLDAYATALSTSGGNKDQALSALKSSLRVTARAPAETSAVTSGIIGIQQASPGLESDQALAFMLSLGDVSNIADTSKIAINAPGAVDAAVQSARAGAAPTADLMKQGGALFAYLAEKGKDRTGESTRTQAIKTAVDLRDFFAGRADDPGTLDSRIKALQQNEKLRTEFFDPKNMHVEAQFKIGLEQLLSGKENLDSRIAGMGFDPNKVSNLEAQLKGASGNLSTQATQAKIDSLNQQGDLFDPLGAKYNLATQAFGNIQNAGRRSLSGVQGKFITAAGAIDSMSDFGGLEAGIDSRVQSGGHIVRAMREDATTETQKAHLKIAEDNLKVLEQIQAELNERNELQKQNAAQADRANPK